MAYLMCMDVPVYSTHTKTVLAPHLMPCPVEHFEAWRNSRLFLRGINRLPEEDERELGGTSIAVKRGLSLSDSYWIKYNKDTCSGFDAVTPYSNMFNICGIYRSDKSAPSLTVTGSVTKQWQRHPVSGDTALYKVMSPTWVVAELAAINLARHLGLPVNGVTVISNTELLVHNFTSPGIMLMQLQPWDLGVSSHSKVSKSFGYSFSQVDSVYKRLNIVGDFHLITILFDVIVSNYDRMHNLSNWGYFKSGVTGERTYCPMYDFNLAHPYQCNQYLHLIKPQITESHRGILRSWRSVVESHGYSCWLQNLDSLLDL